MTNPSQQPSEVEELRKDIREQLEILELQILSAKLPSDDSIIDAFEKLFHQHLATEVEKQTKLLQASAKFWEERASMNHNKWKLLGESVDTKITEVLDRLEANCSCENGKAFWFTDGSGKDVYRDCDAPVHKAIHQERNKLKKGS